MYLLSQFLLVFADASGVALNLGEFDPFEPIRLFLIDPSAGTWSSFKTYSISFAIESISSLTSGISISTML